FFFQAEDGIRDLTVTGVQTCALPISMRTIKGPAIFLAQFAGDAASFNNLKSIAAWAAKLGYKGVQIPSWDARLFDLKRAAESKRSEERRVGKECRCGGGADRCRGRV